MTKSALLTVHEVAEMLKIAPGSVYHWVSQGRLPCVRLSARCLRFRLEDIEQFVAAMSDSAAAGDARSDRIVQKDSFHQR